MHGGGEGGNKIELLKTTSVPLLIEKGGVFPGLILAPRNPHHSKFWDEKAVTMLLENIIKKEHRDTNRIYLTAYSRGALASWLLAMQNHRRFAALVPISGEGLTPYAM